MNNSKKRAFTRREKLIFKIFLLTALVTLIAAGCIRFTLRYTDLTGCIAAQKELIRKADSSTNTASPAALRQRRDALTARLESVTADSFPDAYSLGESVLNLLHNHSIRIRRYRPLPGEAGETPKKMPGFFFAGTTAVDDLLRFMQKLSREHPCWNVTSLTITAGSTPGQLDIAFNIVQGTETLEVKE